MIAKTYLRGFKALMSLRFATAEDVPFVQNRSFGGGIFGGSRTDSSGLATARCSENRENPNLDKSDGSTPLALEIYAYLHCYQCRSE
jgi:hypothetical protein